MAGDLDGGCLAAGWRIVGVRVSMRATPSGWCRLKRPSLIELGPRRFTAASAAKGDKHSGHSAGTHHAFAEAAMLKQTRRLRIMVNGGLQVAGFGRVNDTRIFRQMAHAVSKAVEESQRGSTEF